MFEKTFLIIFKRGVDALLLKSFDIFSHSFGTDEAIECESPFDMFFLRSGDISLWLPNDLALGTVSVD